jgi:hypothetical protein
LESTRIKTVINWAAGLMPEGSSLVWAGLEPREPGVNSAEAAVESEPAQLNLPLRTAREHRGQQKWQRISRGKSKFITCTPEQYVFGKCGKEAVLKVSNLVSSRHLPAWLAKWQTKYPKLCEMGGK